MGLFDSVGLYIISLFILENYKFNVTSIDMSMCRTWPVVSCVKYRLAFKQVMPSGKE